MSLLDSIRNNEILHLHLGDALDEIVFASVGQTTTSGGTLARRRPSSTTSKRIMGEFLRVLERNTSIASIHLEKDFMGDLRHDDRERLLYALGRVQSLKELILADALLQVRYISAMIQDAKSLRYLRLQNLVLQGVQSDFDDGEEIIHGPDCALSDLELVDCVPAIASVSLQGLSKNSTTGSNQQTLAPTNHVQVPFGKGERSIGTTKNTVLARLDFATANFQKNSL